jgi:hypothetical protein
MKPSARMVASAVLFLVSLGGQKGRADTIYIGTFSGMITATGASSYGPLNNPWYVGEPISGEYFYQSSTVDGTFNGSPMVSGTLYGDIKVGQRDFSFHMPEVFNSQITVQNGVIKSMDLDGESGPLNYWFYQDHFSLNVTDLFRGAYYEASGTLTETEPSGGPEPLVSTIPEPSAMIDRVFLLLMVVIGGGWRHLIQWTNCSSLTLRLGRPHVEVRKSGNGRGIRAVSRAYF